MIESAVPGTFWLNLTNVGLGIVTVACCVAVGRAMFQDLAERMRRKSAGTADLTHRLFSHLQIGLTMADGGERIRTDQES